MKRLILIMMWSVLTLVSCKKQEDKYAFTEKALNSTIFNDKDQEMTMQEVLELTKGQTTFVYLWATWCGDCVRGIPKIQALQSKYGSKIAYTFLSLDRKEMQWKVAIEKYNLKGNHFWFKGLKDWDDHKFTSFLDLDWIPRYMVVGKDGSIKLFRAIQSNDPKIIETIDSDLK